MNDVVSSSPVCNLGPLKVKRSYSCDQCGLLTGNPREYLHHLRNVHGEKINIFECKYCIYASKHVQKLHRHCNLVHRQLLEKDPDYKKHLEATKKSKPDMFNLGLPSQNITVANSHNSSSKKPLQKKTQVFFNCSACDYRTRNKAFLLHHEKTAHLKKRFYRCLQCGYVTNEKGRYTKHIKYHSLPKMQCEFCFFKTAYKWNMDRHMKNHEEGAQGAFRCTECNFTTSTRQSFKSHITHHHNANGVEEEEYEDENAPNDSVEWEDVDVVGMDEDDDDYMAMNENNESYDFSESGETGTSYKNDKVYQKSLKCKSCDYKATWPFELKKHEETHRHQKKHPCPLCGMRFEHLAWLSKHLRRVHQENSQAGSFAAAYDLMKPNRRRPAIKEPTAEAVLPIYQQVLKQNVTNKPPMQTNQNSMLSTLLNKPLNPPVPSSVPNSSVNKYLFKSKAFASSTNMSRHLRVSSYNDKPQTTDSVTITVAKPSKSVPTCNVCGYKTRWLSELQRHMRVHSQEKPFHCHKCKYHCKWKGDLNRHLMKYHGIKVPSANKKYNVSKFKNSSEQDNVKSWQDLGPEIEITQIASSTPLRRSAEESPLDLTTKDSFSSQCTSSDLYDPYDFENFSVNDSNLDPVIDVESEEANAGMDLGSYKSPLQQMSEQSVPGEAPNTKRKYQCPFCDFGTTTASRFHVHIVQHFNRRPFMCSVCNHSSNWEWDITKHIRLKGCRDKFNNKACVLLTDESGRRNYEKYEKYLVDINYQPTSARAVVPKFSEPSTLPEPEATRNMSRTSYMEPSPPKSCTYDFRNIGSNFEDSRNVNSNLEETRNLSSSFEDAPENIVVTPDINIPDQSEVLGSAAEYLYGNQYSMLGTPPSKSTDSKMFTCKHCDFKHATKRVVVSHLSLHAGIKPFRCRACGISSNWRHVIVRHVKDSHNGYMNEVEDRINYVQEGHSLRLAGTGSNIKEAFKPNQERNQNNQRQFFECKVCPYRCDKEFYMKFHMKQHRPREGAVFKCDYCPYYVKFKKTLVRHLKLHDGTATGNNAFDESPEYSNSNSCETENLSLDNDVSDVYDFYSSQANDSADDSIAISFDTLNQYSTSESSSPQKTKRHVCEGCPYKTDNKTQYLYHKQFHRPNPTAPFKCTVCSYWATMQHLLTQHMKVHEPGNESENSSPRQRQSKPTPEKTRLEDEDEGYDKMSVVYVKRGDLIVKMFKCGYCPMMNKKKANVRVHQKMHGVIVNNGKFACSYCDYQCLNQGGLTNHLKIHQKISEKLTIIEEHGMEYETTRKRPSDVVEEDGVVIKKKIFSYFCMKCPAQFKSSNDLDIHMKFHGASFPFPCTQCDYRAKHKPHLLKHMTVHSAEYVASRNSSQNPAPDCTPANDSVNISIVKKIDQMLLLEVSELNTALKKTGHAVSNLHRCVLCPAVFIKSATLVYHVSLHGSDGQFKCSQCDYAVNRAPNLTTHMLVHPKKTPVKKPPPAKRAPLKIFPCPKCPAVFYKQDRYDRHFSLHGRNWKFVCEHCDYSVRFAANLIKHKRLHLPKADSENATPVPGIENTTSPILHAAHPLSENVNIPDLEEKKLIYLCDRCPYSQARRDAVQSHMRRHWLRDGFKCPYCDYSSMQSGFLQTHIKMHIQPNQLFPAQCFMKYESFKIWSKGENGEDIILFDDEEMADDLPDSDEEEEETSSKRSAEEDISEPRKIRRLSCDSSTNDSNCFDSKTKVPVVVLSDIFSRKDKDSKKWVPKLKIPKLKITKSSSNEKMYTKINISDYEDVGSSNVTYKAKPSLVVKISKVEGLKNHDKAMYSISTKSSDNTYSSPNISQTVENNSSANFCNSDSSVQTATNNSLDSKNTKDLFINLNTKTTDKSCKNEPAKDVNTGHNGELTTLLTKDVDNPSKSDKNFLPDKVPSKELSKDNFSVLSDFTIDKEIPMSKLPIGSSQLPNGLSVLPEEIKVDL
ncbi:zinc finger protein 208 isoform X2 [Parasteatoda tepidariorum]|nr:uncharacterized protein LOC107453991 isoform X2 [Parasteatoda tepidariorum]